MIKSSSIDFQQQSEHSCRITTVLEARIPNGLLYFISWLPFSHFDWKGFVKELVQTQWFPIFLTWETVSLSLWTCCSATWVSGFVRNVIMDWWFPMCSPKTTCGLQAWIILPTCTSLILWNFLAEKRIFVFCGLTKFTIFLINSIISVSILAVR